MTTLKTYHADEIAKAFDAQLRDEGFVGMYKQAQGLGAPTASWWQKGPNSQAFKAEMDAAKTPQEAAAIHNKWLAAGSEGATKLGTEHDDFTPMIEYSEDRRLKLQEGQMAKDQDMPKPAVADGCPKHPDPQKGCPECADGGGLAIAIDFAIRHMVKLADALDKTGFVGVAGVIDETLQKLAANRPFVVRVPTPKLGKPAAPAAKPAAPAKFEPKVPEWAK